MNKIDSHNTAKSFSRVELIDHSEGGEGRVFVKRAEELIVELMEQDEGLG